MAQNGPSRASQGPQGAHSVSSFTRMEAPAQPPSSRSRSHTLQSLDSADGISPLPVLTDAEDMAESTDVFESRGVVVGSPVDHLQEELDASLLRPESLPDRFDELPIELISLTDRFVESLSAKVYSTPPTIDHLSSLFQEFYTRSSSHISTHVSTLASRLHRESSPSPNRSQTLPRSKGVFSSSGSLQNYIRKETATPSKERQMLTASEVSDRRRARKLLSYKHHLLEEAVERRVCESVYDKLWRHRSTMDEARDEKLRSRTAALALVGIQMKDLGVDLPTSADGESVDASSLLSDARDCIMQMNSEKHPLGKLQRLVAAHKAIVDALTGLFPSSSSADEILPTLIYTLITSPQDVNIISNLLFIQRFRAASKIDGEAAYCLTNLEAAISFLENVDMSTLGVNGPHEDARGPIKRRLTVLEPVAMSPADLSKVSAIAQSAEPKDGQPDTQASLSAHLSAASPGPQQRFSSLFQPPAKALGAANDLVRNTADQGIKNISNTLDSSFNFLFGRLKEVQMTQGGGADGKVGIVPKTLDDARRLVNPTGLPGDDASLSDAASLDDRSTITSDTPRSRLDDRLADAVSGRKSSGDRTPTALKSGKDVKSTEDVRPKLGTSAPVSSAPTVFQTPSTAFDSVKSFGTTLNPLNRIPGVIRGFGRSTSEQPPTQLSTSPSLPDEKQRTKEPPPTGKKESSGDVLQTDVNPAAGLAPPIKKFIEMKDPSELKLGDIPELLEDYKRLALALYGFEKA